MTDKPDAGEAARRIVEAHAAAKTWRETRGNGITSNVDLEMAADASHDDALIVARALLSSSKRIEELEKALGDIDALEPLEINPSNYTHDDVCELNGNAVQAALIARAALEPTP